VTDVLQWVAILAVAFAVAVLAWDYYRD